MLLLVRWQDVNAELAAREVTDHVTTESAVRDKPEPQSEGIQEPQAGLINLSGG